MISFLLHKDFELFVTLNDTLRLPLSGLWRHRFMRYGIRFGIYR